MRTLIQNYTSTLSTEPMYINRCFTEAGFDSVLWTEPNISAFDAFDYTKPDLFVGHFRFLTQDIVKYLAGSNVSLALNVTGANEQEIQQIDSLVDMGIDMPLVFSNLYQPTAVSKTKKAKFIHLYPATDIFLPVKNIPEYEIDSCIITVENGPTLSEAKMGKESYHVFSFNADSGYADFELDIAAMTSFYRRYKKIHIAGDINLVTSQVLFDAMLKANDVNLKVPASQQAKLDEILSLLFVETPEKKDLKEILRDQIKNKHNCFRRVARLCRSLKIKEAAQKMEEISDKL